MLCSKNKWGGGQNLGKNWQALAQNNLCKSASSNLKLFALILINKIEKIWIESETIPPSPTPPVKLKKKKAGTVVLEVVFTLPLVFYMVFFCVELIRINITNDALQTICEEATFLTSAHNYESGPDLIAKIDAIIEKHRPRFIPKESPGYNNTPWPVIRWYFDTAQDAQQLFVEEPYGGTDVPYVYYEIDEASRLHASAGIFSSTEYVPILGLQHTGSRNWRTTMSYVKSSGFPVGRVFVLTFVVNYTFSNQLTKLLFNGGTNTKLIGFQAGPQGFFNGSAKNQQPGTMYLLYARGAGIVEKSN